ADIVSRQIPIQATISGEPASGATIAKVSADPDIVTVTGPQPTVDVMQYARLTVFDLSALGEGTYQRKLALEPAPAHARFSQAFATASVVILPKFDRPK
ncbi:MAG TPA: YbbR-like domain-containing protein, partial [Polyangiaceae bacterium]|nr:YbbR-like domain-containing protein [Polyangiaceae bacterium]